MNFTETPLRGAYVIEPAPIRDERGFFARTFCQQEFAAHGLNPCIVQCNISYNRRKGTLRGLHFQKSPHAEVKVVRCFRGAVYDVIVDIRPGSPAFGQWFAVELSEDNRTMLYVPEGFAHGFQTITDGAEMFYQMSRSYRAESAAGIRWDDPKLAISWPLSDPIVSPRDQSLPFLNEAIEAGS